MMPFILLGRTSMHKNACLLVKVEVCNGRTEIKPRPKLLCYAGFFFLDGKVFPFEAKSRQS